MKYNIHDFPYDAFQSKAVESIDAGHSVMVAAPTGAGKTVLAEYVTHAAMSVGKGIIYTAPIKALSNQKFRDFCDQYGRDQVGILTGDVVLNANAPVLIMTTEIFRNRLFEPENLLNDRTWVIFDEIHYLDDFERGTVWEESLIFFPNHLNLLALSATVPNINDLAKWVSKQHGRPVDVVIENKRPVPLHFSFMSGNRFFHGFDSLFKKCFRGKKGSLIRSHHKTKPRNELPTLLRALKEKEDFPAIFFCFSRNRCEFLARQSRDMDLVTRDERKSILKEYDRQLELFQMTGDPHAALMRPHITHGIAYHHAGILPVMKEIIERLFTSRLIKLIFTTETFAIGINMPAKAVIFDEVRKYYGTGFDFLKTRDFYQMAGRAGRRGYDAYGNILVCMDPARITYRKLEQIVHGVPEPVHSRFNSNFATLLQLYRLRGEKVTEIYQQSFHFFQGAKRGKQRRLNNLINKLSLLKFLGYIDDQGLTSRGYFASRIFGYELQTTELFMEGFFESSEPWEINCMITAMIFEPRRGQKPPRLSKPLRRIKRMADTMVEGLSRVGKDFHMQDETKRFYFHLSESVLAWMDGATLEELCQITDIDEGEIIRNFRMTIQILRELRHLKDLKPEFYEKMKYCMDSLKRDCMDAETQLQLG